MALSISSTSAWAYHSSKNVYEGSCSSSFPPLPPKGVSVPLPGQPPYPLPVSSTSILGSADHSVMPAKAWICDEHAEGLSTPLPEKGTLGTHSGHPHSPIFLSLGRQTKLWSLLRCHFAAGQTGCHDTDQAAWDADASSGGYIFIPELCRVSSSLTRRTSSNILTFAYQSRCDGLNWWKDRRRLSEGTQFWSLDWIAVTTDASLSGDANSRWGGGTCPGSLAKEELQLHINLLELRSVQLALQSFIHHIPGHQVGIKTNNTTAKAYINKPGGLQSSALQRGAEVLFS